MTITLFWVGFFIFFILIFGSLALGGILAAPWVPLWKKDVKRMLKLAEIKPGDLVYDLGAGEGRIIMSAAKDYGAKAVGFEIACLPYLIGYIRIKISGLGKTVKLKMRNFFNEDLSRPDVICMFLTPMAMERLKPKLEKETKPGCKILSYAFKIPGWQPEKIDKSNDRETSIFLYRR